MPQRFSNSPLGLVQLRCILTQLYSFLPSCPFRPLSLQRAYIRHNSTAQQNLGIKCPEANSPNNPTMPSPVEADKSSTLQLPSTSHTPTPSRPQSPPSPRPTTPRLHEFSQPLSFGQRRHGQGDGLKFMHGMAMPAHMASPMEDGYRTPTGEDFEHHFQSRQEQIECGGLGISTPDRRISWLHGERKPSSRPGSRPGSSGKSHLSLSAVSEKLDLKIHWKQRLRHFTWNFFSMTMATGGIANVIRTGKIC